MFSTLSTQHLSSNAHRNGVTLNNGGYRTRNDENSMVTKTPGKGGSLSMSNQPSLGKSLKTPATSNKNGFAKSTKQRRALGDISNRKEKSFAGPDNQVSALKKQDLSTAQQLKSNQIRLNKAVSFGQSNNQQIRESLPTASLSLRPLSTHVQPILRQKEQLTKIVLEEKIVEEDASSVSSVEFPAGRLYGQGPEYLSDLTPFFDLDEDDHFDEDAWRKNIKLRYEREDLEKEELFQKQISALLSDDENAVYDLKISHLSLNDVLDDDDEFLCIPSNVASRQNKNEDSDDDISL